MEDLATLIREAMARKQMSTRDVERESERHGNRVSYSAVSRTQKGNYTPSEPKLQGLSKALDIPIERLRDAAGVTEPGTPFRLPEHASRLSPSERAAIEHVVQAMVAAKDERKKVMGNATHPAPIDELKDRRAESADEEEPDEVKQYGAAAHPDVKGMRHNEGIDEQGV